MATPGERKAAKRELARRARAALLDLREQDPETFKRLVREHVLAGLHEKQIEVVRAIEAGERFISLCCSRRAGKTQLLARLIVLALLEAGFNQAVYFVAPTKGVGKSLIWAELSRLIHELCLDWDVRDHLAEINTPAGAAFRIQGLDNIKQTGRTRGHNIVLCLTDETQEYEHQINEFLIATSPALADSRGVFVAAGTPGYACRGIWYDICHGSKGFLNFHWDIRQNTKFPRDPDDVLREELEREGWTWEHPTFQREWLGLWVEDHNFLVFELSSSKNLIRELPPEYSLGWKHVVGIDYGFNDDCAWVVLAVDPYTAKKYVVHVLKQSGLDGDQAAEKTAQIVKRFETKRVVCDPAGGGKPFYALFNRKYGRTLGCFIDSAEKGAGSVEQSVYLANTELRKERLLLLMPDAAPLADEMQLLRWDASRGKILSSDKYPDHASDALRYALMEVISTKAKEQPTEAPRKTELERRAEEALRGTRGGPNQGRSDFGKLFGSRF